MGFFVYGMTMQELVGQLGKQEEIEVRYVNVPDPHGRLIDAEEALGHIKQTIVINGRSSKKTADIVEIVAGTIINDAPTVIEAELDNEI